MRIFPNAVPTADTGVGTAHCPAQRAGPLSLFPTFHAVAAITIADTP